MTATAATPTARIEFTDAAFLRSHGRAPRGRGSWALQATTADRAFDAHLFGPISWHQGTLSEAKAALRAAGASGLWAILP